MTDIELKPCPFCGSGAIIQEIESHTHIIAAWMPDYEPETFIECTKCNCGVSSATMTEAIERWNTRPKETALESENAELRERMRWIPCSERMPEDGIDVLFVVNGYVRIGTRYSRRHQTERWVSRLSGLWLDDDKVTHWQPLPQPPHLPCQREVE